MLRGGFGGELESENGISKSRILTDRLNESVSLFNHMLFGYNFGHYDDIDFIAYVPTSREIEAPSNATFRNRDLSEVC